MNLSFLRCLKPSRDLLCVLAFTFVPIVVPLAILYVFLVSSACISEIKQKVQNLSGLDFEISYTNCDTFGNSQSMSIFVSKAGGDDKVEIFMFDPVYYVALPQISVDPDKKRLLISVSKIGSIYFQKHRWEDMTVDYRIGRIDPPIVRDAAPSTGIKKK